MEKLNNRLFVP